MPTMEFDIETSIEPEPSPLKKTLSYSTGIDENNHTVVNRLEWRLQWEKLDDKNFWVIDGKARLFADDDLQYQDNDNTHADLKLYSLYVQRSFDQQSIKLGYQTVIFGYMDLVNVSNIFTPQDFSEAVYTAPEDSRIGQPVFSWSYYLEKSQLDVLVNFSAEKNKYPQSDLRDIIEGFSGSSNFTLNDRIPDFFEEPEFAVKWQQQSGEHEYQLIVASLLQNDPEIEAVSLLPPAMLDLEYPRYEFVSAAYSFTDGTHQLKLETSYRNDVKPLDAFGHTLDETGLALGWEYNANGAYTLLLETVNTFRSIEAPFSSLIPPDMVEDSLQQTAISWQKNFLNETLATVIYFGYLYPGNTRITSVSLRYSPADDWLVEMITTQVDSDEDSGDLLSDQSLLRLGYYW